MFGFIHGGPEPIFRHLLAPELQPFTSRCRIVVPIEFRMIRKNLNSAAHQEKNAKEIQEVIDSQPQRKTKFDVFHSGRLLRCGCVICKGWTLNIGHWPLLISAKEQNVLSSFSICK